MVRELEEMGVRLLVSIWPTSTYVRMPDYRFVMKMRSSFFSMLSIRQVNCTNECPSLFCEWTCMRLVVGPTRCVVSQAERHRSASLEALHLSIVQEKCALLAPGPFPVMFLFADRF